MGIRFSFWVGISLFSSGLAFGLASYRINLQFKYPDGTSGKDTLVVTGTDWVEKEIGARSFKLKVEPHEASNVKTTIEILDPSEKKTNRMQFITRVDDSDFSSLESKDNDSGRAYEVKIMVTANLLDDRD